METNLNLYNEILHLSLRPSATNDFSDAKFIELLLELKKEQLAFQPLYEMSFRAPLTKRQKYFHTLILNEAVRFFNNFHSEWQSISIDNEKKYFLRNAKRAIAQKIQDTANVLNYFNSSFQSLVPGHKPKTKMQVADAAYTYEYLKSTLLLLFMNIQDAYLQYSSDDPQKMEELLYQYFEEENTSNYQLTPASKIVLAISPIIIKPKPVEVVFQAVNYDFRGNKKGVLPYKSIIKNDSRFGQFEEQLYSNGYIDQDSNFLEKHTFKQKMAAIIHILIAKKYFHEKDFNTKKEIDAVDIRKFIDFRYDCKIDAQFRLIANNPEKVADFRSKYYWIDKLPTC